MDFDFWISTLMRIALLIALFQFIRSLQPNGYGDGKQPRHLPLLKRIHRRLHLLFDSRILLNYEHAFEYDSDTREVSFPFYVPRKPIVIEVHLNEQTSGEVDRFMYQVDGEWHEGDFAARMVKRKDAFVVEIYPADLVLMDRGKVRLPDVEEYYLQRLLIRAPIQPREDVDMMLRADSLDEDEQTEEVIRLYEGYREKYSTANPWPCAELSRLYLKQKRYDEAGEFALRALVNGRVDWGFKTYEYIRKNAPPIPTEDIEALRSEREAWVSRSPRGAVVLKRDQDYLLGIDGWYLRKFREIFEIRRSVAARRLTTIYFPFDSGNWLLHSSLRVIHPDGEIEVVPDVHFSVQDSEDRVTHREKLGAWVLPDLEVDDIVEWTYDLLIKEDIRIDGDPHFFIASLLQGRFYPTMSAVTRFHYPADWKLRFILENESPAIETSSETEGDRQIIRFQVNRFTPTWGTGYYYENYHFNPSVACGWESHRWDVVTKAMLEHQFGEMEIEDEIPAPLAAILDRHEDPVEALRQGFYWLRDKLKYRPFDWAELIVAHEGWANEIVQSGVANCREKSYLLHQICRKVGIRSELVVVASDRGFLFEEMPANQFNHVFVRAEVDGEWKYLDATYSGAVFTSSPDGYQGMKALVLDEAGTRITIPEVPPERNRVVITETFNEVDGDWLSGHFAYRAEGNVARLADEHWKGITIHGRGHRQSAQEAFRFRFPTLLLKDYRRTSNTARSDLLELTGNHKRCHLSALSGKLIGILEWKSSLLVFDYWETLHPAEFFVFPMPTTLETTLNITGKLYDRLADVSDKVEYENSFCRISDERTREADSLGIRRTIVIKQKFVSGDDLKDLPETMHLLEKAMQVAVSFKGQ